jgi:DNA-directed RNA polymerase subunit F
MQRHVKIYKAEELLRRIRQNIKDLQETDREIAAYLEKVDHRRADNRSSVEELLKLDLRLDKPRKRA